MDIVSLVAIYLQIGSAEESADPGGKRVPHQAKVRSDYVHRPDQTRPDQTRFKKGNMYVK